MVRLPRGIEEMVLAATGLADLNHQTKSRHSRALRRVRDEMRRLSQDFISGRPSESKHSDAYFLYNFPSNAAKTLHAIGGVVKHHPYLFTAKNRYRMLDVGCGDAAGMVGSYYALKDTDRAVEFHFTGIDSSKRMLDRAKDTMRWCTGQDSSVKTRFLWMNAIDIRTVTYRKKYDVILLINSLAEIARDGTLPRDFMGTLYGALDDNGLLVVIEPALKESARRLMTLRDDLARHKAMQILLPCLHESACPLWKVESRDEWCHQSVEWSVPEYLRIINEGLNREIDLLKFSSVVAVKSKVHQAIPDGFRVISRLLVEKGKARCFLCAEQGRIELVMMDRARSKSNSDFGDIEKGNVVSVEKAVVRRPDYWEVVENTAVRIIAT